MWGRGRRATPFRCFNERFYVGHEQTPGILVGCLFFHSSFPSIFPLLAFMFAPCIATVYNGFYFNDSALGGGWVVQGLGRNEWAT
jgi:hypothetical protein